MSRKVDAATVPGRWDRAPPCGRPHRLRREIPLEPTAGSSASARQWGINHRLLTAREIRHEFPQLAPERDDAGLFEPEAGALAPEAAVLAHLGQAAARGAQLHFGEPVEAWEPRGEELLVHSSAAQYRADRLVLAAGAWTPSLLA
ncbi:MAG: FAD-dependent oxidoreductase, partial [Candidatus Dormibacteria bacterium]